MSDATPLFVPSANQKNNSGSFRDRFVLAPIRSPSLYSSARLVRLNMLSFVGRVIGGCLRGGEPMPLYLPSRIWKALLGDSAEPADLKAIDEALFNTLEFLSSRLEDPKFSAEDLEEIYDGMFVFNDVEGSERELFPGGNRRKVTLETLQAFVTMTRDAKLEVETKSELDALVRGFHKVIPPQALWLSTWEDLERAVCGRPDFDVNELKGSVRYEGLSPNDRRVQFLWQILADYSSHERALFMRFVSGRERLPSDIRLKLMSSVVDDTEADNHLPGASTCFFWLSIPNYSTLEVMRQKLTYAIHHCIDIDADFRVRDQEEGDEERGPQLTVAQEDDNADFEDYSHLL
jgi:hypothetical protein